MLKYYTDGRVDDEGDVLLLENYETLDSYDGEKYIAYIIDEEKIKSGFIMKYTHESNIRELIEW